MIGKLFWQQKKTGGRFFRVCGTGNRFMSMQAFFIPTAPGWIWTLSALNMGYSMNSALLTPRDIAAHLKASLSLAQKMIRAAEYAAEIQAGTRLREDVPPGLAGYLDSGFPSPKVIGRAVKRVLADEFERWINRS